MVTTAGSLTDGFLEDEEMSGEGLNWAVIALRTRENVSEYLF